MNIVPFPLSAAGRAMPIELFAAGLSIVLSTLERPTSSPGSLCTRRKIRRLFGSALLVR